MKRSFFALAVAASLTALSAVAQTTPPAQPGPGVGPGPMGGPMSGPMGGPMAGPGGGMHGHPHGGWMQGQGFAQLDINKDGKISKDEMNAFFDRVDTTATTWLGLTMACAQCHDHKYDPITQRDYYSLMDAFNHVPETGVPQFFSSRIRVGPTFVEIPTEENNIKIG
jgi:hypothetical protein